MFMFNYYLIRCGDGSGNVVNVRRAVIFILKLLLCIYIIVNDW